MRSMRYTDGWTRRHFLEQTVKGIFAAGVLSPLIDVLGEDGNCEAAYPLELLSIEAYTKGKLKAGDVLNADNVDIVKICSTPVHTGRSNTTGPVQTFRSVASAKTKRNLLPEDHKALICGGSRLNVFRQ